MSKYNLQSIDGIFKFILDPHDGDFSVTFNEGPWSFIWNNNVLDYYMTIKNYLNNKYGVQL